MNKPSDIPPSSQLSFKGRRHHQILGRLAQAAAHVARNAIQTFASDNSQLLRQAAVDAGLAGEYPLKAILSELDLTLIADSKDAYSIVALSAAKPNSPIDFYKIRTINTKEALARISQLHHNLGITKDYEQLQDSRNAAIHLAHVSESNLVDSIHSLVRLCDTVLSAFKLNQEEFWTTELLEHVAKIRSDEQNATSLRLSAKLTAANQVLQSRVTQLGNKDATKWNKIAEQVQLNSISNSRDYIQQPFECPSCKFKGVETFYLHRDTTDQVTEVADLSNKGAYLYFRNAYPIADEFTCGVCDLHLYEDEIRVSGMPYELDAIEVEIEDYEPPEVDVDWDWYLGR